MSYINQSLSDGEEIVALFRVHWMAYAWPAIITLGTAGLLIPIAILEYLRLKYLEQGLTNKRVILKRGIVSRKTDEMKIKSIETVEIDQGIFGRILGFGTIKVTGRGISDVVFKNIDDPMSVKKTIESVSNPAD